MVNKVVKDSIFNYICYFIQVYWVFILIYQGVPDKYIPIVVSIGSLMPLLCLPLLTTTKKIFKEKKPFRYMAIFNTLEILSLLLLSFGLYISNTIVVIFGIYLHYIFYNTKIVERDSSILNVFDDSDIEPIYTNIQVVIELGYSLGLLLAGIFLKYYEIYILIFITIIPLIIYNFKLYTYDYKIKDTVKIKKDKEQNNLNIKNIIIYSIFLILALSLFYGEDSFSSYIYSNKFSDSEFLFGIQNSFIFGLSFINLKIIGSRLSLNNRLIYSLICSACAYITLININTSNTVFIVIIYSLFTSSFCLFYSNMMPFIDKYIKASSEDKAMLSNYVTVFGSFISPFILLSSYMYFPKILFTSWILFYLIVILIYLKIITKKEID